MTWTPFDFGAGDIDHVRAAFVPPSNGVAAYLELTERGGDVFRMHAGHEAQGPHPRGARLNLSRVVTALRHDMEGGWVEVAAQGILVTFCPHECGVFVSATSAEHEAGTPVTCSNDPPHDVAITSCVFVFAG